MEFMTRFPANKIARAEIVTGNLTLNQLVARYKPDFAINGGMWTWKTNIPCPVLKVKGSLLSSKTGWDTYGYGWDIGPDIKMGFYHKDFNNFIACTPLLDPAGPIKNLSYDRSGQGGSRGRTAMGTTPGGDIVLYVSKDGSGSGKTPEQLVPLMQSYDCSTAIMLDSGGSSQCYFKGKSINTGRPVHNWICFWMKGEKKMPTVCIDPGHGDGCVNGSPDKRYKEDKFAWDMGQRLKNLLTAAGVKVLLTREEYTYPSLAERVAVSNNGGADCYISLHSNASPEEGWSSPRGLLIYTSVAGDNAGRNILARGVINNMRASGVKVRGAGIYHNKKLYVTRETICPAILVEHGFHTNREDVDLLLNPDYRQMLAEQEAKAILDFLGVNPPTPPEKGVWDKAVDMGITGEHTGSDPVLWSDFVQALDKVGLISEVNKYAE